MTAPSSFFSSVYTLCCTPHRRRTLLPPDERRLYSIVRCCCTFAPSPLVFASLLPSLRCLLYASLFSSLQLPMPPACDRDCFTVELLFTFCVCMHRSRIIRLISRSLVIAEMNRRTGTRETANERIQMQLQERSRIGCHLHRHNLSHSSHSPPRAPPLYDYLFLSLSSSSPEARPRAPLHSSCPRTPSRIAFAHSIS